MPEIESISDLAHAIGLNVSYLQRIARNRHRLYRGHYVTKRRGGRREIEAPNSELKTIQRWILRNLLEGMDVSDRAKGYVRHVSVLQHACLHLGRTCVLLLDIKDFFPSIGEAAVGDVFCGCSGDSHVVSTLTALTTFRGHLPQGAPTSPTLSNLVFKEVDSILADYCDQRDIAYSRYSDDLAFSSNSLDELTTLKKNARAILGKAGFRLNNGKTKIMTPCRAMVIGGLRVNSGHATVGRKRKRELRAAIHNWIALQRPRQDPSAILGTLAYLRGVEPEYYETMKQYARRLAE